MKWLTKVWEWLKKNWKWIVFPVGLTLLIIELLRSRPAVEWYDVGYAEERNKEMEIARANEARDAKLKELADRHQERLSNLTSEQERELEDLTEKPIEEVVRWFDKL